MNAANTDFNELLELCGKVRDNELTNSEHARLEKVLLGDPKAVLFYRRFMKVYSGLEQVCGATASDNSLGTTLEAILADVTHQSFSMPANSEPEKHRSTKQSNSVLEQRNQTRIRLVAMATATAVLLAVGIWWKLRAGTADPRSLVAVVGEFQTVWGDGLTISESQRLPIGSYVLRSGASQLRFDNGVELLVQAPSVFSIDNQMQATLETGSLTLSVPETGKGFRVETPLGTVVDQGTRIGIMTDDESGLAVHVFEGSAETVIKESAMRETLTAGEAAEFVRIENQPPTMTRMVANPSYFTDSLSDLNHLPKIQGDIELLVSPPRSVRRIASELVDLGHASIFAERREISLEDDLNVTCNQAGRCVELETLAEQLPAGTRVDSYLIHLTVPRKMRTGDQHLTADGTITFPRAVLAVVTHEPGKMDSQLRSPDTDYPSDRRTGLEDAIDGNSEYADRITLSEDRRTLTFHLDIHGRDAATQEDFIDQFRVLMQAGFTE